MLTGFIIGMIFMYFLINLYFASISINIAPTEYDDVRKLAWKEFWLDLFFGVYLVGIIHKTACYMRWMLIVSGALKKKGGKGGE